MMGQMNRLKYIQLILFSSLLFNKDCLTIVPSVGYNKYLIPPPIAKEKHLSVNFTLELRETIFIDEENKYLRSKRQNTKEWYNSYLTFQNLKKDSINQIYPDDENNMWLAIYDEINTKSKKSCELAEDTPIFKVIPQPNFDFVLNSETEFHNARLFEASCKRFWLRQELKVSVNAEQTCLKHSKINQTLSYVRGLKYFVLLALIMNNDLQESFSLFRLII